MNNRLHSLCESMWMKVRKDGDPVDFSVLADQAAVRHRKRGGYVREVMFTGEVLGPAGGTVAAAVLELRDFIAEHRCNGISVWVPQSMRWDVEVTGAEALIEVTNWLKSHAGPPLQHGRRTSKVKVSPSGMTGLYVSSHGAYWRFGKVMSRNFLEFLKEVARKLA